MIEFGAETRRKLGGTITLFAANPHENKDVIEIRDNNDNFIADVCLRNTWCVSSAHLKSDPMRGIIASFHNSKTDEIVVLDVFPRVFGAWFIYVNSRLRRMGKAS